MVARITVTDRAVGPSPTELAKLQVGARELQLSKTDVHLACWACAVVLSIALSWLDVHWLVHVLPVLALGPDGMREVIDRMLNF